MKTIIIQSGLTGCLLSILCQPVLADNREGIRFYKMDQPEIAKQILLADLVQNQGDAQTCYYLGEIYFLEQKTDSAAFYFNKGLSIDPESALNQIGKGKLLYKTDISAARQMFKEALSKKGKNDVSLLLAVAKALSDNGSSGYAKYLETAKNINPEDPEIYLTEGDIFLANKEPGSAAEQYELAIHFDKTCIAAYLKYAKIYENKNPGLAIDMLQQLLEIDPHSVPALKELGRLYYTAGKFSSAAEVYERYRSLQYNDPPELIRYALILYYNKNYQKSLEVLQPLLLRRPDELVPNRIAMYDLCELKQYDQSLAIASKVMQSPGEALVADDYIYYGRLLNWRQEYPQAAGAFEKALALDSTKYEVWKFLSEDHYNMNRPDDALSCYKNYLSRAGSDVKTPDLFELGRLYLKIGVRADSARKAFYLVPADSIFARITQLAPDNFLGYQMRAQANASLDDTGMSQGLAKPYYEKMLELAQADPGKRKTQILEGYRYLGVYYLKHDDNDKSREYWNKILEIDPEDTLARQVLESFDKK